MNKLVYLLERTLNSRSKKLTKQDEYMFYSPFVSHYKPKLQINILSQKWHCWVSNQGGHSIYSLFKKINADSRYFTELKDLVFIPSKSEDETESKIIVSLPREFLPLWVMNKSLHRNQAKSFLHKRDITDVDIKKYKIGFCDSGLYEGRIIIPSYDDKGLLNYFVGRSFVGEKMKYKNPNVSRDIVPFDWYIAWSKPIVLCEGVFDAMSIRSNAIPMLSKKPSKSLLRKIFEKNVKTIYIALDDDAKKDAYNMSEFFRDFGIDCKVVKLPTDKDPNDLGWKKITTLIHSTESASFSDSIQARLYG
jgi:hypothetical protein